MSTIEPTAQMWATLALAGLGLGALAYPRWSIEFVSLAVIAALLLLFQFYPMPGGGGPSIADILSGFANPSLIAVVALVVVGHGMVRTGALDWASAGLYRMTRGRPRLATGFALAFSLGISAFLNNTPVVVMFIPILVGLASRVGQSPGQVLMPLSFAVALGGNITLIGSSTNMMGAATLRGLGEPPLGLFDLVVPGLVVAAFGLAYLLIIGPKLLPKSAAPEAENFGDGRQFVARLIVEARGTLDGAVAVGGMFAALRSVTVLVIEREGRALMPPFEDVMLQPGDVIVIAASRHSMTELLARGTHEFQRVRTDEATSDNAARAGRYVAEAMVPPDSRLVGLSLSDSTLPIGADVSVLGIQRRSRMSRSAVNDIRLASGDVLLIQGRRTEVRALRANRDVVLLEWSGTELPAYDRALPALGIFLAIVGLSGSGTVPIEIGAFVGVVLMILTGCLNLRQAARAIDRQIVMIGAMSLALDAALRMTGGANYLAMGIADGLAGLGTVAVLSGLFLFIAVIGNFLSNNASAVLFTPIGVGVAHHLGVDPLPFIVGVIFASSASFATPVGYVTNLLVMAPGRYRPIDFLRLGGPLTILVWIVFSLFAAWYYDLW